MMANLRLDTDVLVLGSGPSGFAAAYTAAKNNAKVILIEQCGDVGGISTTGLMSHWTGSCGSPLYYEILRRSAERMTFKSDNHNLIDPEKLKTLYLEMLDEVGVKILLYTFAVDAICDGYDVFVPGIMELVERTGVHSGDSMSVYPPFSISDKVKGIILQYAKKLGLGIGIVGLYNIQFIVDRDDNVYIIEVNPRSSRTVPFLSKATGYSLADIATEVILGKSLKEQGIFGIYPEEKERFYVKAPVFSFNKLRGMDAYLSPEMKSTGEAIGYDKSMTRALYKALQAAGMHLQNYGTVLATIADRDKQEALELIRRFYNLGFNIEATAGTAKFLKANGIRTHVLTKISDGSDEIPNALRQGHIAFVINTRDPASSQMDGLQIRQIATENNVTLFTALDTVKVLLDVLEETTLTVSTIDA